MAESSNFTPVFERHPRPWSVDARPSPAGVISISDAENHLVVQVPVELADVLVDAINRYCAAGTRV